MTINYDVLSPVEKSQAKAFEALLYASGRRVVHNGFEYKAIRRMIDFHYSDDHSGYTQAQTFEFEKDDAPSEGDTIAEGNERFMVEGTVHETAYSLKLAVSKTA